MWMLGVGIEWGGRRLFLSPKQIAKSLNDKREGFSPPEKVGDVPKR